MFGATEFDRSKERDGPPIREQVEGMAALIKAGKIRHYGLSNETAWGVCEFRRVARELGVPGPGDDPEQLQPGIARRRQRSCRGAVSRKDVAARLQSARRRHAVGQVSRRRANRRKRRFTLFDGLRPALSQADRSTLRSTPMPQSPKQRGMTLVQLALGYVKSRWYLGATIIGATSMAQLDGRHRRRAMRTRRGDARGDCRVQVRFPNPAG